MEYLSLFAFACSLIAVIVIMINTLSNTLSKKKNTQPSYGTLACYSDPVDGVYLHVKINNEVEFLTRRPSEVIFNVEYFDLYHKEKDNDAE